MVKLSDYKTTKHFSFDNNILTADEGYWITTNEIYITSFFTKSFRTDESKFYGTVTEKEKNEIEKIQKEIIEQQLNDFSNF